MCASNVEKALRHGRGEGPFQTTLSLGGDDNGAVLGKESIERPVVSGGPAEDSPQKRVIDVLTKLKPLSLAN
jgi:hypothetical protein